MPTVLRKDNLYTAALHLMMWSLLLFYPYLLGGSELMAPSRILWRTWPSLLFAILLFYINYFYLIRRFLFNKQFLLFFLVNAGLVVLSYYAQDALREYLTEHFNQRSSRGGGGRRIIVSRNIILWLLAIGLSVAEQTTRRWLREEKEKKVLENEQLLSKLSQLKYQLQPHFFFNALNTIYALTDEEPEKAKKAIHALGKLMRYMLHDSQQETIPLSREIEFLQRYIDLMSSRSGSRVEIRSSFPNDTEGLRIPPLLFIPLVENAFKHGMQGTSGALIAIHMIREGNQLVFTTSNPIPPHNAEDRSVSGIGLNNLQKRLEMTCEGKHSFTYGIEHEQFVTSLSLQL